MSKVCSKCKIEKSDLSFYKRGDKLRSECKDCENERNREYAKTHVVEKHIYMSEYRSEHKEDIANQEKQYREGHKDQILSTQKQYREEHKEETHLKNKIYKLEHKEDLEEYRKQNKQNIALVRRKARKSRYRDDPTFRLNILITTAMKEMLNFSKNGESKSKYLSYTIQELKEHLEKQFETWMNWDNQGVYDPETWDDNDPSTWVWNIDHIIPKTDLSYTSMKDDNFKKCWDLENLRPLSAKQNILDGTNRIRHNKKKVNK